MIQTDSDAGIIHHPSGMSISSEVLKSFPNLRHASTTRAFVAPGTSRLDELWEMRQHLGAPNSFLAFGEQQHTNNVSVVSQDLVEENQESGYWRFPQTDAIVSPLKNVTLAIQTADCAPVFLFDPVKQIIALAHAGWKGSLSRIVSHTSSAMRELGTAPEDIIAWVGPMAGGCCYEVSEELIEKFKAEFADLEATPINNGRHLDLVEVNCCQLSQSGLLPHNIHRSSMCTIHNRDRFYSYRADNGTTGRIISALVMLESR